MTLRVMVFMRRRADITHEQFIEIWTTDHAKIFGSVKKTQEKNIRYNQFTVLTPECDRLKAVGLPILEYDAIAEYYADSLDDVLEMLGDKEYQEKVMPDENNFLDKTSFQVIVGKDYTPLEKK